MASCWAKFLAELQVVMYSLEEFQGKVKELGFAIVDDDGGAHDNDASRALKAKISHLLLQD